MQGLVLVMRKKFHDLRKVMLLLTDFFDLAATAAQKKSNTRAA
jgi:hypothetical protein